MRAAEDFARRNAQRFALQATGFMQPIDRLIAEQDISRLITQFGLLNDSADWAAVTAMFTDDARFIRPAGGDPVVGRDAIRASFESRPPRKSCHLITNIVVDVITTDEASARSTLVLYAAPAGASEAKSPALIGGFRDRLVHTSDGWKFAERTGFLDLKVSLA
ncbi:MULTISPECIES: nuclear transport factor 2 family protein [unclassified Beijerinckia]|uniref:nuclear transport factor 2 family protein n=1 Tax=unclassified Beijerinckia TaxID=2638183 RepID=UPI000899A2E0|nr:MULTISPECIES: nuclear transport factor 2 family protein [unclassified Beijerinckia]MDH7799092.1 ketosteroid isomerase-like protein [Beijerinckia sp. GAS462]SED95316.1 SnoaL-like domain-containing protein [Beijerinckia sp. 28-YEA-48]